jgi:hypothetical protein
MDNTNAPQTQSADTFGLSPDFNPASDPTFIACGVSPAGRKIWKKIEEKKEEKVVFEDGTADIDKEAKEAYKEDIEEEKDSDDETNEYSGGMLWRVYLGDGKIWLSGNEEFYETLEEAKARIDEINKNDELSCSIKLSYDTINYDWYGERTGYTDGTIGGEENNQGECRMERDDD